MSNRAILIVDDDKNIRELLKSYFVKEGFTVATAGNGPDAVESVSKNPPDIMLLDLMLPGMDGFSVIKELRRVGCEVPVIMITARDEESDKLIGLEIGADDYVAKPFSPKEVVARAKAVLRRVGKGADDAAVSQTLSIGDIKLDPGRHEVTRKGKPLELTPVEFKILELFMLNPGQVLSRVQIMERVQGYDFEGYQRTIDAHIKNIRKKIERDPAVPQYLLTVFGFGYKFAAPEMDKK
jgi:DNA-binding response OmpR family regulator